MAQPTNLPGVVMTSALHGAFRAALLLMVKSYLTPDRPPSSEVGTRCVFDYGPYAQIFPEAERVGAIIQSQRVYS